MLKLTTNSFEVLFPAPKETKTENQKAAIRALWQAVSYLEEDEREKYGYSALGDVLEQIFDPD